MSRKFSGQKEPTCTEVVKNNQFTIVKSTLDVYTSCIKHIFVAMG